MLFRSVHAYPSWITSGHQAGAGRRAHRTGGIELGEPSSVFCQTVDAGCTIPGGPVTAEIAITEIVTENDDEIGWATDGLSAGHCNRERHAGYGRHLFEVHVVDFVRLE